MRPESTGDYPVHCIVTFQPVTDSLIEFSEDADECKDHGRDNFFHFMRVLDSRLKVVMEEKTEESGDADSFDRSRQPVVDYSDPATGLPMVGQPGPTVYSDADGVEQLLTFDVQYICGPGGGCRVISHPKFGMSVYPATGFVAAPTDVLLEVLKSM